MKKLPEYFQRFNKEILQKKVDFKKFDVKKTKEYFLQKHILKRVGILVGFFSVLILYFILEPKISNYFYTKYETKENVYYSSLLEKELTYDLQENYKICNTFLSNLKEGDFFDKKYLFPIYSQVQERFDACKRIGKNTLTYSVVNYFNLENDLNTELLLSFQDDLVFSGSEVFLGDTNVIKLLVLKSGSKQVLLKNNNFKKIDSRTLLLSVGLQERTHYNLSILDMSEGLKVPYTSGESFDFQVPEKKIVNIRAVNPVSLYKDSLPPEFSLLEYNTGRDSIDVKLCRIGNEEYMKIEYFVSHKDDKNRNKFLKNDIDSLKTFECFQKNVSIKKGDINKVKFDFSKEFGDNMRSGLYFLSVNDSSLRSVGDTVQQPVFFGIVDSHVTFKISKEGQGFFFVNDFSGKPLGNISLRAQIHQLRPNMLTGNTQSSTPNPPYKDVMKTNILSQDIPLGKTDKNGILLVDMNAKIKDAFLYTDAQWEDLNEDIFKGFFITATSKDSLSYNSSRWNAGIAPFNFGYTVGWGGYDNVQPVLYPRDDYLKFNSHVFSERKVYLPGEEVHIKAIIRTTDLKIPSNKPFGLVVLDTMGNEISNDTLQANDFGSIYKKLKIEKDAKLGNYQIILKSGDIQIAYGQFSVEVFQNPKFKNDITLKSTSLVNNYFTVNKKKKTTEYRYDAYETSGKFDIQANLISTYYNGGVVKNSKVEYKVYRQEYYGDETWEDCFYGCYYEPQKELYTSGEGKTDKNGKFDFTINVDHKTIGQDYKYIVETIVTDEIGDTIAGSQTLIVKIPEEFKLWNSSLGVNLTSETNFYNIKDPITFVATIGDKKWDPLYNNKYVLVVKKIDYKTTYVNDVKGYKRPTTKVVETIEDVRFLSSKDDVLKVQYTPKTPGEYVFEYGTLVDENGFKEINKIIQKKDYKNFSSGYFYTSQYKTIVVYGDTNAQNPVIDDNKVQILSDKVVYKVGEKAKFLIRLPFSQGKILWNIEQKGILKTEFIDVQSNIFFKEIEVTNDFAPNAYISVVAFDTFKDRVNEYKLGYAEIVIDKNDKKSKISIKTNKKEYLPREEVVLNIDVKNSRGVGESSEVSLMVVDDSLVSLMGNIDLNMIDKFYTKYPFQFQTSLTNIVMLANYYFSRPGMVGGSGFGNFKGGDSAVSTRNIFKNTAYYNPSIITDASGKAQVKFTLPDNLTNFRVIAISNSKKSNFGVSQEFISVRKNILVETKAPLILRDNDIVEIKANIFNQTQKNIGVKVLFESDDFEILSRKEIDMTLSSDSVEAVSFKVKNKYFKDTLTYKIKALGDTSDNSDIFEGVITLKNDPILIKNTFKQLTLTAKNANQDIIIPIGENVLIDKTKITLTLSNNKLAGVEKLFSSLMVYPYGCIEQTTSSTLPNAIIKGFGELFDGVVDQKVLDKNINDGVQRILSMQNPSGGFAYWPGDTQDNLQITPYVLRSLIDIRNYTNIDIQKNIDLAKMYLEANQNVGTELQQSQIAWALAKAKSDVLDVDFIIENLNNTELPSSARLFYTYALYEISGKLYSDIVEKNINILKKSSFPTSDYYWDTQSFQAILASLIVEYGGDETYINKKVDDFYKKELSSYYYSTQTKNNIFQFFYKYLAQTGVGKRSEVEFYHKGTSQRISLGGKNPGFIKQEFDAKDFVIGNNIVLPFEYISGENIFIDVSVLEYPKDVKKIKPYKNKLTLSRKIYEVTDSGEKLVTGNTYHLGKLYRTEVSVITDDSNTKTNLTIEDYLPAGFLVSNSKFKTVATEEKTSPGYYFERVESRPEVFFSTTSFPQGEVIQSYYFRPQYPGTFVYPPVSAYYMYEPEIRAYSRYDTIIVK